MANYAEKGRAKLITRKHSKLLFVVIYCFQWLESFLVPQINGTIQRFQTRTQYQTLTQLGEAKKFILIFCRMVHVELSHLQPIHRGLA